MSWKLSVNNYLKKTTHWYKVIYKRGNSTKTQIGRLKALGKTSWYKTGVNLYVNIVSIDLGTVIKRIKISI